MATTSTHKKKTEWLQQQITNRSYSVDIDCCEAGDLAPFWPLFERLCSIGFVARNFL